MILDSLSIINYKNIASAQVSLSPNLNCFIGDNGMGKTNLLDAVYYLSFCKSSGSSPDSALIRHGEEYFVLEGSYRHEDGEPEDIYCGMKKGIRKRFRRNRKEYKKLSQHIGLIPIIYISPSDVSLIEGSGDERRRLMDVVISQYDATYMDALNRYAKALQQRNSLLKMEEEPDPMLLGLWEEQMAEAGEMIYRKRDEFVREMIPVFQKVYSDISGDRENVSLNYISHCQRGPLLEVIQRDRFKDRAVGYSLHGVHRDDLEMLLDGFPMRREGSQGQNKTFVIALKLAQFSFLRRTCSTTTPLLLLDDIFDKLDATRVERIIGIVSGNEYGQIFITDTNRTHLDRIVASTNLTHKIFEVKDGVINLLSEKGGED